MEKFISHNAKIARVTQPDLRVEGTLVGISGNAVIDVTHGSFVRYPKSSELNQQVTVHRTIVSVTCQSLTKVSSSSHSLGSTRPTRQLIVGEAWEAGK